MREKNIHLSKEFKKQATKAILAISFFMFIYFLILFIAVLLTSLCIMAAIWVIIQKPMFYTIALGVGMASFGVLILIFLLKFMFKSNKVDLSNLIEISQSQEPKLFEMIKEIVLEVGTSFPKKVYLSTEVNASVFYDSSFWSMFLPIKKNLQIGLGLVNTITQEELRAILSHEFGHFSQRTMKIGSYVYNVNKVVFNMLYDNEKYEVLIQQWANVSGLFSIFVGIAIKINEGIQWVLRKLYEVVNKTYMGLSREMEFHADEIAASITGYEPLKSALLRMSIADASFEGVLNFYNKKISENLISENIYREQMSVMLFLAEYNKLTVKNDLPEISLLDQRKFDKSKLVIINQWASHPSIQDRIERLEKNVFSIQNTSKSLANNVFANIQETQILFTKKIFQAVNYSAETKGLSLDDFQKEYKNQIIINSFSEIYNSYYDNKNLIHIDLKKNGLIDSDISFQDLFSDEKVDMVYTAIALQNDIEILNNIVKNVFPVKSFDYDGVKFKRKEALNLIEQLNVKLEKMNLQVHQNDQNIYVFFSEIENEKNKPKQLEKLYNDFFIMDKSYESKHEIYVKLVNDLQFVAITTPYEQIKYNFKKMKSTEELLKLEIIEILSDDKLQSEITQEIRKSLEQYVSNNWEYFGVNMYYDDNLNVLHEAMNNYAYLLSRRYFLMKKEILVYQECLLD